MAKDKLTRRAELALPVITSKLGRSLVDAANEQRREDIRNRCINTTKEVMDRITHYREKIRIAHEDLAFFESKLEAIDKGEFTLDGYTQDVTFDHQAFNYRRE